MTWNQICRVADHVHLEEKLADTGHLSGSERRRLRRVHRVAAHFDRLRTLDRLSQEPPVPSLGRWRRIKP
jgi:hypothetical protein